MNEKERKVLSYAELALDSHEALYVNSTAGDVGVLWARLKREAADKESGRKELQQSIQQELMDAGANKTAAEPASRADSRYVQFLQELAELGQARDEAEVLWKVLHTRAALLGGVPTT